MSDGPDLNSIQPICLIPFPVLSSRSYLGLSRTQGPQGVMCVGDINLYQLSTWRETVASPSINFLYCTRTVGLGLRVRACYTASASTGRTRRLEQEGSPRSPDEVRARVQRVCGARVRGGRLGGPSQMMSAAAREAGPGRE